MVGNDTIFALSSGGLPSGVAVIRVSGPESAAVVRVMTGFLPAPRQAALRSIRSRNGIFLDKGLVIYFSGSASFTGEDSAELHVHGGRATVRAVLDALREFPGLRAADAGEFSRRAFHHGKLDLVEIEGLADIVAAQTEMQRRLALEHASGGVSRLYDDWARRLTHARAMIEAELDFADEEDVPGAVGQTVRDDLVALGAEVRAHLAGSRTGEIIRDGLTVVIAGPPNVGKSSLINYLAKRDVAIVTDIPGTTRDIVSVDLDLDGFAVRLLDTAGIRETDEVVEREGIRRARSAMAQADLILRLLDEDEVPGDQDGEETVATIYVASKADIHPRADVAPSVIAVSTRTGGGIDVLLERIRGHLPQLGQAGAFAVPSRDRHNEALRLTLQALEEALAAPSNELELQAEYLRLAANEIGRITGRVDVENLLDVIFAEFCIGK
ncbi:tRNA uridine-5-carboxymethylaminomethyl(34) synthesis GTPase MnmE [Rhizobium sp. TRM96647]|uniref:tRNA uridine-5-carboxymethylaminomethyl(34) synthesis GTPase MnmE n=1 Tax=unclassified Rhizobium TaxID=2613769 RepID=UPI0021E98607|nr:MULTISPECIES: tRNA uridine-5-carboxymethylaminomethyl(34) synthesis GTPase MnmE [unclassified Rhizobium]MCV3735075.1 tRNA uridine-5-carboxymethylaminomethyl(34) synthesis GTPase MnmE [Rhizobium sp. TRM96647]MCV3757445.1 tRNA uridine-5-carboxymethylaminomethyl(34) synthesis GTPase MnmE [Rhizobium sp. TRM96650]